MLCALCEKANSVYQSKNLSSFETLLWSGQKYQQSFVTRRNHSTEEDGYNQYYAL